MAKEADEFLHELKSRKEKEIDEIIKGVTLTNSTTNNSSVNRGNLNYDEPDKSMNLTSKSEEVVITTINASNVNNEPNMILKENEYKSNQVVSKEENKRLEGEIAVDLSKKKTKEKETKIKEKKKQKDTTEKNQTDEAIVKSRCGCIIS